MKLNSNHEPAWSQPDTIDGNGVNEFSVVTLTLDGGCLVSGATYNTEVPKTFCFPL